ncbi:hypothetical protein AVEN_163276-1, partial [Araneus ventricosus]
KDKEFQMTNIGISAADENQSFTSAYEDFQTDPMNGKHEEIKKSENELFQTENPDGKLANNLTFSNRNHIFAYSTEELRASLSKDDQNNERKNIWIPTNSDLSVPNKDEENNPHYYSSTFSDDDEFAITSSDSKLASFSVNEAHPNALHLQKDMIKTASSTRMAFNISSAKDETESNTLIYKSSTPLKDVESTGISLKTKLIGNKKIEVKTDAVSLQEGLSKTTPPPKMVSASLVTKETDSSMTASNVAVLDTIENFSEKNLNKSRNDMNLRVKAYGNALEAEFAESSTPKLITYMKNAGNSAITLDNREMYTSNSFKETRDAITSSKVLHETENTTINSLLGLSSTLESKEITEKIKSEVAHTIDESISGTNNSKAITQHQATITTKELSEHSIEQSKTTLQSHLTEEKGNPTEYSEEHSEITGWFQSTVETNYVVEDFKEPIKKVAVPQSTVKTSHLTEDPTEPSGWSQLTNEASYVTKDSKETPKAIETSHLTEDPAEPSGWSQLTNEANYVTKDSKETPKVIETSHLTEDPAEPSGWSELTNEANYVTKDSKETPKPIETSHLTEDPAEPSGWSQLTNEVKYITKDSKETPKIIEKSKAETNHLTENSKTSSESTEWFQFTKEYFTEDAKVSHKTVALPQSITEANDPTGDVEEPMKTTEKSETAIEINYPAGYSKEQPKTTAVSKTAVEANHLLEDAETDAFSPSTTKIHYLAEETKIPSSAETTADAFSSDITNYEENIEDIFPLTLTNEIPPEISESPWEAAYLTSEENFISQPDTTKSTIISSTETGKKTYSSPETLYPINNPTSLPINFSKDLLKAFKTPITQKESNIHKQVEPEIFSNTEIEFSTTNANTVTFPSSDMLTKILISNREKARRNWKDNGFPHRIIPDESMRTVMYINKGRVTTTTEFTTQKWHKWGGTTRRFTDTNAFTTDPNNFTIGSLEDMIKAMKNPTAKRGSNDLPNGLTSPTTVSSGLPLRHLIKENFDLRTEANGGLDDLIYELTSPTTEAKGGLNDLIDGLTNPTTEAKGGLNDLIHGLANPTTEAKGGLNDLIYGLTSPETQTSGLSLNEMIDHKFDGETTSARITTKEGENKFVPQVTNDVSLIRTERDTERTLDNDYFSNNANSDSDIIRTERDLSAFGGGQFGSNQGFDTPQPEKNVSPFGEGQFVVNQGFTTALPEDPSGEGRLRVKQGFPTTLSEDRFGEGRLRVNQGFPTTLPEDPSGEGRLRVNQGFPTTLPEDRFGEGRLRVSQGFGTPRPQKNNSPFEENQFGVKQGFGTPRNPEHDDEMINFRTGNIGGKSDINGNSNTDSENNPNVNLSGNFGFGMKDSENNNLGKDMTTPSYGLTSSIPSGKWLPSTATPNFDSNSEVDVEYEDFDANPLSRRTKVPGGKQATTSFAHETTATPFDGSVPKNPPNERQSGSTSTRESSDSSQSTVATTESSRRPFYFTIDADYDEVVGSRKTKFEENLTKQLAVAMRVPLDCVQNMQVKKGSIEVNFDLVPNSDHGHLADEKALKAAADELKRMIDNGQLTINDLDGNTLVVVPLDPPTDPPPASSMEHTTLILGVVIGAFILTVITVAIAAIIYKRKSSSDHRLSPIEEVTFI